jgi:glycogen phosphorylase
MSTTRRTSSARDTATLLKQYGCGPIEFTGTDNALYERHLLFDNIVPPAVAGTRERYEAFAHSVRDILSQRWVRTESAYEGAKRVYYLSMEFLIGRSLTNNVTNLLLDPLAKQAVDQKDLDWLGLVEEEPDAGLGNGGLGRLAACFLDSMATMQLPAMGYGLRCEYGIFKQIRSLQPRRAGCVRAAARDAADAGRSLHAPGRTDLVPGGGPAALRAV